ncbi:MAG: RNA polymerase sigma factor [Alphaproteobacteria bacterium]
MFNSPKITRFDAYQQRLFSYAVAISGDVDTAADLLQDCVVRVMGARNVPKDDPAYRAWLFTIVRNLWRDHQRRRASAHKMAEELQIEASTTPVSMDTVIVNIVAVRSAFAQLSSDHRNILALVDVAGFGYAQAAGILDIPVGTVMSRVSRARGALAQFLSDSSVTDLHSPTRKRRT